MCGSQHLPGGWTTHLDGEGRTYYANAATGETTWTRPATSMLPDGWTAHQDSEGRTFYANASTGESAWTCPEVAVLPDGWSAHQDSEGRTFYVNATSGESTWTCPSLTVVASTPVHVAPAVVHKEFGLQRVNTACAAAAEVDQGTHAFRLNERLMCGGFFQQINHFVGKHAHKFDDPSTDGSGHSLESFSLFQEYESMLSKRCEHFLESEGVSAEEVVDSMLMEEEQGKKFKSSEYLMAAIDFEMFVSLMLDFKTGAKDVSRWWEVCEEEQNDWYTWVPAE